MTSGGNNDGVSKESTFSFIDGTIPQNLFSGGNNDGISYSMGSSFVSGNNALVLNGGFDENGSRIKHIIDVVKEVNPDVLALQETYNFSKNDNELLKTTCLHPLLMILLYQQYEY